MSRYKKILNPKSRARIARKRAIRKRLTGTSERPRISVFRTAKHIYVQAVDDAENKVLAACSDLAKSIREQALGEGKKSKARAVGMAIGKRLLDLQVNKVVFDRNGYIYHGRVKELADGAREAGLQF